MGPKLVDHLLYEAEDSGILWIRFNRPELMNALIGSAEENGTVAKVAGREPVTINRQDAAMRGIAEGDVVRLFNSRGACLAGARLSDALRPGVVVLPTGAWYDPAEPAGLDRHGNPNVLTLDKGTSRLGQGPSAHTTMVEVEKFHGEAPAVEAFEPPRVVAR